MHFLLPTRFIMLIAAFALLILIATATHERGWLDDYFRVHHKAHLKLNFSCKNRTLCEKPSEDKNFLATLKWPEPAGAYVDCMDWLCTCPLYGGAVKGDICQLPNNRGILTKAVRKEIRQFTPRQRAAYFAAMNAMQADGTYRQIGILHKSAGVHSGPSFFPWHREFLKRVEFTLRLYDPSLVLPYWDSTLDSHLPSAADSILFSWYLMGEAGSGGDVWNSQFVNFRTMDGRPTFNRQFGAQPDGEMISESRIEWTLNQTDISHVLAYSMPLKGCKNYTMDDRYLEFSHDRTTSSNDVIFLLHHGFIDLIWELWRQKQQTPQQRENDYPADEIECEPPWHFKNATIPLLGTWRNVDGLSNRYAEDLNVYATRPTCTTSSDECESEFLWCDTRTTPETPHCVSKIKAGGNCEGFEWSSEACYGGESCLDGRCSGARRSTAAPTEPLRWRWVPQPAVQSSPPNELAVKEPKPMRMQVLDVAQLTPSKITRFM